MSTEKVDADSGSVSLEAGRFFSTPELAQRLDLLRHLADNSERIPVVTGPEGAGKTRLLQRFQQHSRYEWALCRIDADPMLHPEQLIAIVARSFGVTEADNQNLEYLVNLFHSLQSEGRLPIIAVDDADQLPVATLMALFRLYERRIEERALVRIILFARPEIENQFHTPQMQAMNLQVLQSMEMPVFNEKQAGAFIRYMFNVDGQGGGLNPGKLEKIYKESGGLPGEIERLIQKTLDRKRGPELLESDPGRRSLMADIPAPVLVGGVLMLLMLTVTLFFQDEINQLFEPGPAPRVAPLPDPPPVLQQPNTEVVPRVEFDAEPQSPAVDLPLPEKSFEREEPVALVEPPSIQAQEVPSEESEAPEPTPHPGDTEVQNEIAPESKLAPEAEPGEKPPVEAPAREAEDTPAVPPVAQSQTEGALEAENIQAQPAVDSADSVPEPEAPPVGSETKTDGPVAETAPATQPAPKQEPVAAELRESWLMSQPSGSYTLQLLGVQDERAVQQFLQRHNLQGEAAYFRSVRKGKPWFSVVYGIYPDRASAVAAKGSLAIGSAGADAWPRSLASIKKAIQAAK